MKSNKASPVPDLEPHLVPRERGALLVASVTDGKQYVENYDDRYKLIAASLEMIDVTAICGAVGADKLPAIDVFKIHQELLRKIIARAELVIAATQESIDAINSNLEAQAAVAVKH